MNTRMDSLISNTQARDNENDNSNSSLKRNNGRLAIERNEIMSTSSEDYVKPARIYPADKQQHLTFQSPTKVIQKQPWRGMSIVSPMRQAAAVNRRSLTPKEIVSSKRSHRNNIEEPYGHHSESYSETAESSCSLSLSSSSLPQHSTFTLDFDGTMISGRERELQQLVDALDRLESPTVAADPGDTTAQEQLPMVLISGESGSGKTMLVETFRTEIQQRPSCYFGSGKCLPSGSTAMEEPYAVFIELVQDVASQLTKSTSTSTDSSNRKTKKQNKLKLFWRNAFIQALEKHEVQGLSELCPAVKDLFDATTTANKKTWDDNLTDNSGEEEDKRNTANVEGTAPNKTGRPPESTTASATPNAMPSSDRLYEHGVGTKDQPQKWKLERLRAMILNFFGAICDAAPEARIVLFLDDLQWAQPDSISLLNGLLLHKRLSCKPRILVICAFRSHELSTANTLFPAEQVPKYITTMQLENHSVADIADYLQRLTKRDADRVEPLARLVHRKTMGNALFVVQFMHVLQQNGLIHHGSGGDQHNYGTKTLPQWEWNESDIADNTDIADDVISLISKKLRCLPRALQLVLNSAAMLGQSHFDAERIWLLIQAIQATQAPSGSTNVAVSDKTGTGGGLTWNFEPELIEFKDLSIVLDQCVELGFLEQVVSNKYQFSHDKILEASYALLAEASRPRIHYQAGSIFVRILAQLQDSSDTDSNRQPADDHRSQILLLAVFHLNQSRCVLQQEDQRKEVATLNLEAAELALCKSAFVPARGFLEVGISLMTETTSITSATVGDPWDKHYGLLLKLHSQLAQAYYYSGQHEDCQQVAETVFKHGHGLTDKIPTHLINIRSLYNGGKKELAINKCIDVLRKLGVWLPRKPSKLAIIRPFLKVKRMLNRVGEDALCGLPIAEGDEVLASFELLHLLQELAYDWNVPELFVIALLKSTERCLKYGLHSGTNFTSLGAVFARLGDFKKAEHLAKLGMEVSDKLHYYDLLSMVAMQYLVFQWRKPWSETLDPLLNLYEYTLDSGAIQNIYHCCVAYILTYFAAGLYLESAVSDARKIMNALQDYGQTSHARGYLPYWQLFLNLSDEALDPFQLTGEAMDESEYVEGIENDPVGSRKCRESLWTCRLLLCFYFKDIDGAEKASRELWKVEPGNTHPILPIRILFHGLTAFALYKKTKQRKYRRSGCKMLQKLRHWVKDCGAVNVHHMFLLLDAEYMTTRRRAHPNSIRDAFDKAISSAARSGFGHHRALGNELAGSYFWSKNDRVWASTYLHRARDAYSQWGAHAKVKQVKKFVKEILNEGINESGTGATWAGLRISSKPQMRRLSTELHNSISLSLSLSDDDWEG